MAAAHQIIKLLVLKAMIRIQSAWLVLHHSSYIILIISPLRTEKWQLFTVVILSFCLLWLSLDLLSVVLRWMLVTFICWFSNISSCVSCCRRCRRHLAIVVVVVVVTLIFFFIYFLVCSHRRFMSHNLLVKDHSIHNY